MQTIKLGLYLEKHVYFGCSISLFVSRMFLPNDLRFASVIETWLKVLFLHQFRFLDCC